MMRMPASSAWRGPTNRAGRPLRWISPSKSVMAPGQDLHECALARAILAANGVDLAGICGQRDVPKRSHAAEAFADVPHFEPGRRWGHCGFKMSWGLAHDSVDPSGAWRE